MGDKSKIEWTDATWNPVNGCERISPGCVNCYAERFAARFSKPGERYHGLVRITNGHPQWTGVMKLADITDENSVFWQPTRWRRPRLIFANSMSDLFHKDVPFEFIDAVLGIVALCARHTFQVLTKRPERMAEYFERFEDKDPAEFLSNVENDVGCIWGDEASCAIANAINGCLGEGYNVGWPMKNLWLGTSVEDQQRANERIPHLMRVPAYVRWLSCEPLLGPLALRPFDDFSDTGRGKRWLDAESKELAFDQPQGISWVVVGGESGPGARPMNIQWAQDIVTQCEQADVPCFVKQLGAKPYRGIPLKEEWLKLKHSKGGDLGEFPPSLRIREYPDGPH